LEKAINIPLHQLLCPDQYAWKNKARQSSLRGRAALAGSGMIFVTPDTICVN
jgi:hypothetical protein